MHLNFEKWTEGSEPAHTSDKESIPSVTNTQETKIGVPVLSDEEVVFLQNLENTEKDWKIVASEWQKIIEAKMRGLDEESRKKLVLGLHREPLLSATPHYRIVELKLKEYLPKISEDVLHKLEPKIEAVVYINTDQEPQNNFSQRIMENLIYSAEIKKILGNDILNEEKFMDSVHKFATWLANTLKMKRALSDIVWEFYPKQ